MRTSNNIPVIEHEDIINIFTENLRTKRKEKKYTQEQFANYAQTECQFRYCGTAIPFLTVRSTAR